jgi:hypothetical protein
MKKVIPLAKHRRGTFFILKDFGSPVKEKEYIPIREAKGSTALRPLV